MEILFLKISNNKIVRDTNNSYFFLYFNFFCTLKNNSNRVKFYHFWGNGVIRIGNGYVSVCIYKLIGSKLNLLKSAIKISYSRELLF